MNEIVSELAALARANGYKDNMGNLSQEQVLTAALALGLIAAKADPTAFVKAIPAAKKRGRAKGTKVAK